VLCPIDLHKHPINLEHIAITAMSAFESMSVSSTEFDTPEPDGLIANDDASFFKQIFDISVTEIKTTKKRASKHSINRRIGHQVFTSARGRLRL